MAGLALAVSGDRRIVMTKEVSKPCVLCHLWKSLVEERNKKPFGAGFAHQECLDKVFGSRCEVPR